MSELIYKKETDPVIETSSYQIDLPSTIKPYYGYPFEIVSSLYGSAAGSGHVAGP